MKTPSTHEAPAAISVSARSSYARVVFAALMAVVLAGLFALAGFAATARAQEMPAAMQVGGGEVSIKDGEVYAGNGCAKALGVTAGECEKDKGGDTGSDDSEDAGPSGAQYDEKAAEDAGSGSPETPRPVTEMEGTAATFGEATDLRPEPAATPDHGDNGADGLCAAEGPKGETTTTTVERVLDGDTIETPEGTVRLIGVDTPETVDPDQPPEPGGEEASDFTTDSLEGEEVELEIGEDPEDDYDRALAYAWTDEGMFNETLLREGYAELLIIEPNDAYEECLAAAEASARDEGLGIWAGETEATTSEATTSEATTFGEEAMGTTVLADPSSETPAPPSDSASEEGDGRQGFLQTLFGGGDDEQEDAPEPVGGTTTFGTTTLDTTTSGSLPETRDPAPSAAGAQYDESERQEPETQEPEKQEKEIQEPEVQEGRLPAASSEAGDLEVAAAPTPATSTPATVTPATAPPSAAPIATLPETSGVSLARLAVLLPALLLGSGVLTWSVLRRPGVGAEGPAGEEPADEARG